MRLGGRGLLFTEHKVKKSKSMSTTIITYHEVAVIELNIKVPVIDLKTLLLYSNFLTL
jgi:hypothetical protein